MGRSEALSLDVIHLICDELSLRNDFDALYKCVISSRYVANSGAVKSLYKISHECFTDAPRHRDVPEEAVLAAQILQKTAILWRSIILSSLGFTLFPYCQHLRVLDLRDLGGLLDPTSSSSTKIRDYFFSGPMSEFELRHGELARGQRLSNILYDISVAVLSKAPLIESLSEPSNAPIFARMLPTSTDKLSHLRQLELMSGDVLDDASVRATLHKHCPNLQEIRIFSYNHKEADGNIADFLNGFSAGNLVRFETISRCGIKEETCAALSRHGTNLKMVKLTLDEDGFKALPKLKDCVNIQTLAFEGTNLPLSLKTLLGDEFPIAVGWLKDCKDLRRLVFDNIPFTPELLTPMLETHDDVLQELTIEAEERNLLELSANLNLASALAKQKRLEVLYIEANGDEATEAQRVKFLEDICQVGVLRHLELRRLCDSMLDDGSETMMTIFRNNPQLETLYHGGTILDDSCLKTIALLGTNLKSLSFAGMSALSFGALNDFIAELGPGNRGFALNIYSADLETSLTAEQQLKLRGILAQRHEGSFTYTTTRDEQDEYSESDFSD